MPSQLRRSTTFSAGASAKDILERSENLDTRPREDPAARRASLLQLDANSSPLQGLSPLGKRPSMSLRRGSTMSPQTESSQVSTPSRIDSPLLASSRPNTTASSRPNTTASNAGRRSMAVSFSPESPSEESVPRSLRRASAPVWKNPLQWDDPGEDGDTAPIDFSAVKLNQSPQELNSFAKSATIGAVPWKIEKHDDPKDLSRRGSKETRVSSTGSTPLARLDPTTAACLDFLSPTKPGQVAFGLQRKLKEKALHAKIHLLLQEIPYLQEVLSPLLLPKDERTLPQLMALRNFMCMTPMFQEVADNAVLQLEICRCLSIEVYNDKEKIIRENEAGDRACVLLRGSVVVSRKAFGNQELARLKPVWSFGDVALKVDAPRNASCSAAENGTLVSSLSRKDYRRLLIQTGPRKTALLFYTQYFPTLMTDQQRITLAFVTEVKEKLPKGSFITEAGHPGSHFFFIRKGTCNVVFDLDTKHSTNGGAGGLSQLQKLRGRDQRQQTQKPQVPDASEKENDKEKEEDEEADAEKDEENASEATDSPRTTKNQQGQQGNKPDVLGDDSRTISTPSWMWQSRNILVTLAEGDFFGMEAAVSDGGRDGSQRNCYSQTVVAGCECEIFCVPVTQFQQVFPKAVQQAFRSTLLAMSGLRNERTTFLAKSIPASVTDYSIPERRQIRSRQSGLAQKFRPVKTELKYQPWKMPERDLEMEALCEESEDARNAQMEVRMQERTYQMPSSICLQNCPGDLLKPLLGQPRSLTSMGFRHVGPQQRSPPTPNLAKLQGDRKHHRVMLQGVGPSGVGPSGSQGDLPQHQLLQRPQSSPQL